MNAYVKIALALNLAVLALLAFIYPNLMIAPGKLIPGHRALDADCFACHVSFQGVTSDRCRSCHKPDQIGRVTTQGAPIEKPLTKVPFHQQLASQDCIACHSDHAGVQRFRRMGGFRHDLLAPATQGQCTTCHKAPDDALHRQLADGCQQCHNQNKWTPATFDHTRFFVLDRNHNTRCATCHTQNSYQGYTCYGCHEHTPEKIRREHIEEGIRKFDACVECHRSANKHDIKGRAGRGGERGGRGREHDD